MSLKPTSFTQRTGLMYDKASSTFWGNLHGYPVFLTVNSRQNSALFRLSAKAPDAAALRTQISEWSMAHTGVSGLNYQPHCLAAMISLTPRNTEENLSALITELVSFAASQGMVPCCMSCGSEYGYQMYLLDDDGIAICDDCKPNLEQQLRDAVTDAASVRANPLGQLIGAIIGAVTVFLLTYFVLKLHYLSFLTAFAGTLLGIFLIRKLGKKLTIPASAIFAVLCITAGVSATMLHFADVIAEFNVGESADAQKVCDAYEELSAILSTLPPDEPIPEEIGDLNELKAVYDRANCILAHTDAKSCLTDMSELLKMETYSAINPELVKCLVTTLLSILLCIIFSVIPTLKADKGIHTLRGLST